MLDEKYTDLVASMVEKHPDAKLTTLKEACVGLGFLTEEKFDEVFKPEEMAGVKK
mgnify:CR=1 FL=1